MRARYNLPTAMADIVIRPSMKFIKAGYAVTLVVIVAAVVLTYKYMPADQPKWLPWVWIALIVWPVKRHIQRQSIKLTIAGEKLSYENGIDSKSTRIIKLPQVK